MFYRTMGPVWTVLPEALGAFRPRSSPFSNANLRECPFKSINPGHPTFDTPLLTIKPVVEYAEI